MSSVAFDTLKLARRLQNAGFSREQADGTAEALADTLTGEVATKGDLSELKADLKGDILELRLEMQAEFVKVRGEMSAQGSELRGEITAIRGEIAETRAGLRGEIAQLGRDTAKWIMGALLINVAAFFAAVAAIWQLAHK